ncbi:TIGR03943 family putative permease subunit [Cyanobium sp. ATX 6F1]|uniref:TIGR03943 family putative permease subunit n=1 Tax=Cyanobium sp. ATX 6F1 TaxID=2823702 RepID=UPI0039657B09
METLNALLRPLALGFWGLVLVQSGLSGRLDLLVRAVFHPLIIGSGVVLLALAALDGVRMGRQRPAPRRNRTSRRERAALLLGFALALAMLLVPPVPSFADLAANRPGGQLEVQELSFVLPPAQRSLTDWVRLLRSQPDPALYAGDPVRISGFVLPVPGEAPELARLLVRCCLADATPFGLPVRWPAGQPLPQADQWLAIEGVMALDTTSNPPRSLVIPGRITPIQRPRRPFEP